MTAHLRTRDDGSVELRVNGVFVMDDVETSSERVLAQVALEAGAHDVLVGGFGLGFTARALLDGGATRVLIAELEPEIVRWCAEGLIGDNLTQDPRCEVLLGDVVDVVAAQPAASWDAIVLDVDNGPDFLVHEQNAGVYATDFLSTCRDRLRPGGLLAIWSMNRPPELAAALDEVFSTRTDLPVPVDLQGRAETYWVLSGLR